MRFPARKTAPHLLALLILVSPILAVTPAKAAVCDSTSKGYPPLIDLGSGLYKGVPGGLYPGGNNQLPQAHLESGLLEALAIMPLDGLGQPDAATGRIAFVSIGMCNTSQEFASFISLAGGYAGRNPRVDFVNGAQGGATAAVISNSAAAFWDVIDQRLSQQSLTPLQVQAVWLKEANAGPTQGFPGAAQLMRDQLRNVMGIIRNRFPNARVCYLSSRIYAGYASTLLNPEPYAYESGFAIKWLIEEQLDGSPALNWDPNLGSVESPWLAWGPYLWADGLVPRSDGLTWVCTDFAADGTHPAETGRVKVANQLLDFLIGDATARLWFLATPASADGSPDAPARYLIQDPAPNPFQARTTLRVALDQPRQLRVTVLAPSGRRLKILSERRFEPGNWTFEWDGSDSQGRPVGAGVYFLAVQDETGMTESRKVLLIR
ncbi:MAG: hypothetical protein SGI90_00980 [Candidatus Eisenbacteria bacterium]|nr:hypothetical protein [Candidatus Eisenbacteria bacterium]